jgi:hypothetical protein
MSEFDDTLTRLFAEARETPPSDDFLESVARRISHARRRRAIGRTAVAIAAVAVAIALTPYVAEGSLAVASHLGNVLSSPVAWICSLAVAAYRASVKTR